MPHAPTSSAPSKATRIAPSDGWQDMGTATSISQERPIRFLAPFHRGRNDLDPDARWAPSEHIEIQGPDPE